MICIRVFDSTENISSVWMHSKKYFEKYFQVFDFNCILENAMENQWWQRSQEIDGGKDRRSMVVEIDGHLQW